MYMAIPEEQRIKLECMQIKGIRWMIWQNINPSDIESRLLSIKKQGAIADLTKCVNTQSHSTLISLIELSPEIQPSTIDAAYERYRYGLKPGFTLFWAKHNGPITVPKELLEEKIKAYVQKQHYKGDAKYKGLEFVSITTVRDFFEVSLSYLQRFNYINEEGEFTHIYMLKECFAWVGINRNFIAINNMPDVLVSSLKRFFSTLYHADITNIIITNSLLKKVFSAENAKRVTRHNSNPPANQLEKVVFADPKLSEKLSSIPAGYEEYDVTNTQYIEDIDGATTGTLGVNCSKGKLYLSKSLTSSQFQAWSIRRINDIISYIENSSDVTLDSITGLNMFTSSQWESVKPSSFPILNEIVYALVSCKQSKIDSCPLTITPSQAYQELNKFFIAKVSFSCDHCEEKVIPSCEKCGSSHLNITKKPPFRIVCQDCGDSQSGSFSFICENGHESVFESIDEVIELTSSDEFSKKLFVTITKYFPNVSFENNEFFSISSFGLTIHRSPSYAKLRPSDIDSFSTISNRALNNSHDKLNEVLFSLKEKCPKYPTNEDCYNCKQNGCNTLNDLACLLKLFEDFEGFMPQPHQGHEFGDVSFLTSMNGQKMTFLGVAKSGRDKITKASKIGREIIQQVIDAFNDARAEITGVIYPGIIDDQLKYFLYHEAKVHNKRLVIMDNEFMVHLLDAYLRTHEIMLS